MKKKIKKKIVPLKSGDSITLPCGDTIYFPYIGVRVFVFKIGESRKEITVGREAIPRLKKALDQVKAGLGKYKRYA